MLTIDHGFNNSTFTSRVIASSGADLGAVVSGALGALSGPFHGGAPARVFDMLDAIGSPDNAEPWLRDAIVNGDKLMGFGHRIYKTIDPRSQLLHEVARELHSDRVEFSEIVEKTAVELLAELKPGRELYANVEFYAGVVLEAAACPGDVQRHLRLQPHHRLDGQRAGADRDNRFPPACALRGPDRPRSRVLAAHPALRCRAAARAGNARFSAGLPAHESGSSASG